MWLKKLVAVTLVITIIALNGMVIAGLLNKPEPVATRESVGNDNEVPPAPSVPITEGSPGDGAAASTVADDMGTRSESEPAASTAPLPTPPPAVYCNGRTPCYGRSEVAARNTAGNCWGWNGDRVINISGLNAGFHKGESGVNSIEVSGVCGADLSAALGGNVSANGTTNDHKASTKNNSNSNLSPYFVGWFDAAKP